MALTTCVFDAYGTLFDVSSAARRASEQPGREALAEVWPSLAKIWRDKQLQYTWLRAITGHHVDFWRVTEDALEFAMESEGLDDPVLRETLLALYWELEAYDEVPDVLQALKTKGLRTVILSNGSPDMLDGAVEFSGLRPFLDNILSVESAGIFKPSAKVYDLVGETLGCTKDEVLFISSNGWDVAGAAAYGFQTAWVNRAGDPKDRLFSDPDHVLSDLNAIPELV